MYKKIPNYQCVRCLETKDPKDFYYKYKKYKSTKCKECEKFLYKERLSNPINLAYERKKRQKPLIRYNKAVVEAKRRNKSWNIPLNKWLKIIEKGCHYCSTELLTSTGSSLDRIDNSLGYEIYNVLPCCSFCNKVRMNSLTVQETEVAIKAILALRALKAKEMA